MTRRVGPGASFDHRHLVAFLSVFCLTTGAVAAPRAAAAEATTGSVEQYFSTLLVSLRKAELDNGLAVVLDVERRAPLVAISVTFPAGRNRGGAMPELVDALRHRRVSGATPDHALVRARGAASYQSAGWEHATFTQVLPPDELPFGLWLEGQRLRPLSSWPAPAAALVDAAERSFSLLHPERRGLFELERLAWPPPALEALGVTLLNDVWFTPRNAVLTISGDFDGDEALRLLDEYVSGDTHSSRPPSADSAVARASDASAQTHAVAITPPDAALSIGFVVGGADDPSYAAVTLAAALLDGSAGVAPGPLFASSRTLAARVEIAEARGRALLVIHSSRRSPGRGALTAQVVFDELARLAQRPLSETALEALRKTALIRWLDQFASSPQRSELLGRYELLHGDARLAARHARELANVSASDVRRVLATLTAERALVHPQQEEP